MDDSSRRERPTQDDVTQRVLHRLLQLPDLRERLALCLMNVYGDEADPAHWLRRADEMAGAAPRPGDFNGNATKEELDEAYERCMNAAELCRFHAFLLQERADDEMRNAA